MYQMSYAETVEDSGYDRRAQERQVFNIVLSDLRAANDSGAASPEAARALTSVLSLWSILINDLTSGENSLPENLRADLISIGLWCLKQADAIRVGESDDFQSLIEINQIVCDGLN